MNIRIFAICFLLSISSFVFGQQIDSSKTVKHHHPEELDELVDKHKQLKQEKGTIKGFRVQIFFDSGNTSKNKAYKVQADFLLKYPDVKAYVSFQAPNYRVRVGDFRTAIEAQGFVQSLKAEYPNAYYVPDEIELPDIKN